MDNIAHWLGGMALTGRPDLFFLVFIFSNFPDILSAPFFFYYAIKEKFPIKKKVLFEWKPPREYLEYYRFFHSILGTLLITSVFNVFFPQYTKVFLLCYISHIILDMFSHGGFWATRIFYPFSDFHLGFTKNHWEHKLTRRTIFIALLIININILIRHKIF
ncbi:MAG: metal-dependent hydrolase [Candidatus Aenigmarchaeota archaeon]|nr:metal-dependent hydrolase [Candidatus Aenigmarchaeota archaeon]